MIKPSLCLNTSPELATGTTLILGSGAPCPDPSSPHPVSPCTCTQVTHQAAGRAEPCPLGSAKRTGWHLHVFPLAHAAGDRAAPWSGAGHLQLTPVHGNGRVPTPRARGCWGQALLVLPVGKEQGINRVSLVTSMSSAGRGQGGPGQLKQDIKALSAVLAGATPPSLHSRSISEVSSWTWVKTAP